MIHLGTRCKFHLITKIIKSPAKVYFLLMGKMVLIKCPNFIKDIFSYCHASPTCPKYFYFIIILPLIFFQVFKYAPPAKRITKSIYKSSRSSRIFKIFRIFIIKDLGLDGRHQWLGFKNSDKRLDPVGRYLYIAVE